MSLRDLFRRRPSGEWSDPSQTDPAEALRKAREGLAETGTYEDEHGRRRKLPEGAKESIDDALARAERSVQDDPPPS
jgi:hypothetical protein